MSWINDSTRYKADPGLQPKSVIAPGSVVTGTTLYDTVRDMLTNISTMKSVWQERRKLENLSDDQLRDIGISLQAAQLESKRHFADIPQERKLTARTNTSSKIKWKF